MLSYEVVEYGKPLQWVLKQTPQPIGGEVLVRVTRSGVCRTDLQIRDGAFELGGSRKFDVEERGCVPPFSLGHEPYGSVEAFGPQARDVEIGRSYVVYPWIGCGRCAYCDAGQDNYCRAPRYVGITAPGAYSTHLMVPDARYLIEADGVDPAFAATLSCSALSAYSGIQKFPEIGTADWVVVLGCGGRGQAALSLLAVLGIGNVIACDIDSTKLLEAKKLGASALVNTRDADAVAQIRRVAGGNVAAAIDFVGVPATADLGIGPLKKGGRYVLCGLFGGEVTLPLPSIAQRGIGIIGSYLGTLRELREVVALARSGRFKAMPVQTRPASAVNRSLDELRAGRIAGRVVLDMQTAV